MRKGLDTPARIMYRVELQIDDAVNQIKAIIQKIKDTYIEDDEPCNMRLISSDPVVFSLVPKWGGNMYRFTINFPDELKNVQKDLITGISTFMTSR